jgi:hypothetical protein
MLRSSVQGQLFDAPFMYASQSSHGSTGRYDNDDNVDQVVYSSGFPEVTALRRRENDSFAAPEYNTSGNNGPQRQPQHNYITGMQQVGVHPQNYSFPSRRRKQQSTIRFSDPETWIKLAMRAVLLSPVLVLVVWSIAAISFSNRQMSTQQLPHQQLGIPSSSSFSHQNNNKHTKMDSRNHQKNRHNQNKDKKNKYDQNRAHQAQDWISNHLPIVRPNTFASTSSSTNNIESFQSNGIFPQIPPMLGVSEEMKQQHPVMGGAAPLIVEPQFFPSQGQGSYYEGNYVDEENVPRQQQMFRNELAYQLQPQPFGNQMTTMLYQDQQSPQQMSYESQMAVPYYQDKLVSQQQQQMSLPQGSKNAFYYSFQDPPSKSQQRPSTQLGLTRYLPQFVAKRFQRQQQYSPAFGMIPVPPESQQLVQVPAFTLPQMEEQQRAIASQQQYVYEVSEQQQQSLQEQDNSANKEKQFSAFTAELPQVLGETKQVYQQLLGSAMSKHHTYLRNGKVKGGVRYYFYDPRSSIRRDGSLYLPSIVYDTHGRPVSFNSLSSSASNSNQIYIEPPRGSSMSYLYSNYSISNTTNSTLYNATLAPTFVNTTNTTNSYMDNYTWVHPNVVHTPVHDGRKGMVAMSEMRIPEWGDSTSYDSSIIVCTVGVMALLVGAISARRMRSRSILSMCIENESLEDDIAYDTAYTVSAGDSNQYHTFNNQGWKGDLEKFDV